MDIPFKGPRVFTSQREQAETLLNEKTPKQFPETVSFLQLGLGKGKYRITASSKQISQSG